MNRTSLLLLMLVLALPITSQQYTGFFDFSWDDEKGKLLLEVKSPGEEFIYVNSLVTGVGSNDLGLDRGQLGSTRLVRFEKTGEKILLIQSNTRYRAISENPAEVKSVKEAFAESVLWGFKIEEKKNGSYIIDLSPFLLRDAHNVTSRLKSNKQGSYKVEKERSAVYLDNTFSFPDNSEFEALITLTGEPEGSELRSVTPSPQEVSVRQHHSFVRLPDDNYRPREFHPFSGYYSMSFADYATPIQESMQIRYITRHRLEKRNPDAVLSEPVEPIVYYIDPGCPEPVKSALMEGAAWWNEAFEYAGFQNAFHVRELPDGAHPMDVRYNIIQWVHRSTRGWSYGSSVTDPRTGEIIKGHVSLGSLRVRQDFLIAQGIMSPYSGVAENDDPMTEVALARLRQLSAHEVGHTIGLVHNFTASVNDRASVMDYPHPYIKLDDGQIIYEDAYDIGIGIWDKRAILYGYKHFTEDIDEKEALSKIIKETKSLGLLFMADSDSRPPGSVHPQAHLWDNGSSAIDELKRINQLRSSALNRIGLHSIKEGVPYSELEKVLVPVYLMHRYQAEAVSKIPGGMYYSYSVKGDEEVNTLTEVPIDMQKAAVKALLETAKPALLKIPQHIVDIIPPPALGYSRDRESFKGHTGLAFDPISPAEAYINDLYGWMLNEERLARIQRLHSYTLSEYLENIIESIFEDYGSDHIEMSIAMQSQKGLVYRLIQLSLHANDKQVAAIAHYQLEQLKDSYLTVLTGPIDRIAHIDYLGNVISKSMAEPDKWKMPQPITMPPGAPIGCGGFHEMD